VLRHASHAQRAGAGVGYLEPADAARADRHSGQERLRGGELGSGAALARSVARCRRPSDGHQLVHVDARGLLPLPAALQAGRRSGPGCASQADRPSHEVTPGMELPAGTLWRFSLSLAALACAFALTSSAHAEEPVYEFLRAAQQAGYGEVAVDYLQQLAAAN